jgi:hypothetical protein
VSQNVESTLPLTSATRAGKRLRLRLRLRLISRLSRLPFRAKKNPKNHQSAG